MNDEETIVTNQEIPAEATPVPVEEPEAPSEPQAPSVPPEDRDADEIVDQIKAEGEEETEQNEEELLELWKRAEASGYFPTFLDPTTIADRLGISTDTIYRHIRRGKLHAYNIADGARTRWRSTNMDVLEYISRKDPGGVGRILKQQQVEIHVEELLDFESLLAKYKKFAGSKKRLKPKAND